MTGMKPPSFFEAAMCLFFIKWIVLPIAVVTISVYCYHEHKHKSACEQDCNEKGYAYYDYGQFGGRFSETECRCLQEPRE
jgi:hypothetical protein